MLIPSIDLQNGAVVQLVQGDKLAIRAADAEPWIQKFSRFPRVQLIDLDAAMGKGDNAAIVSSICGRLPCRVGGGIRSVERAQAVLGSGAHAVIATRLSSATAASTWRSPEPSLTPWDPNA